jgi:predicted DNA-binding protein with PD1-like motif
MQHIEQNGLIIIRLFEDEDFISSLKDICRLHQVKTAVPITAIGQIKKFTLGYLEGITYLKRDFTEIHELLSISGIISLNPQTGQYDCHLHAIVGSKGFQVLGGHFFGGVAQATNEIVLQKSELKVQRKLDPPTGTMRLWLE